MASRREEVVTLGAIRKRGKHYAITYYDATGKRKWETVGPNLHEARQVLADRMWERRNGKFRLSRPRNNVAAFATKWQEDYLAVQQKLGRLKPSTASSYQSNLAKHILPFLGAMHLRDVTLPHVREFIKALLAKDLAPKTIGNVILILKEIFKHAIQWGYLESNPVQYVELPRGEEKEMEVLTPEEVRRLLEAQEEPLRTLLLTAVLTGMRQGELFGLQWSDVDLEGHRIHVRRSLWHGELGTPKSKGSRRAIDLPPTLEDALKCLSARRRSEFVFCSRDGTPMDADNFRHREFPRALRRAGLRRIRFHDLRHTYASLLIAQVRIRSTSKRSSGTRRFRRRSTATGTSCPRSIRRKRGSSISSCSGTGARHGREMWPSWASGGPRTGAKWEQKRRRG
jgi:integrase